MVNPAMATGMERVAVTSFSNIVIAPLVEVLKERYKMLKNLKDESEAMQREILLLAALMDDQSTTENRTAVAGAYSEVMRDLTHDMEDCIERFLHPVTCKEGASLRRRAVHRLSTLRRCSRFASSIKKLRKRLDEARNGIINPPGGGQSSSTSTEAPPGPGSDPVDPNPVGIAEATKELLTLLDEVEGEPGQLRVISIVGFGGSGKTTLANAVYQEAWAAGFGCRAWVDRSKGKNARELLKTIIQKVRIRPREDVGESDEEHLPDYQDVGESDEEHLRLYLKKNLKNMRYLIVIDDIEMKQWNTIKSIMENNDTSSRIIVTTTIQSIANQCSFGNGYVYKMRTLGKSDSRNIVFSGKHSLELERGSATLLKKCDGLPLALVSVANHLRSENELTGQRCADLCRNLGIYLQDEHSFARHANITLDNFVRLRGMLMDYYTSLPDYVVRTCLLYLGIFPHDRPLKRNVIIRRWLAEGYARSQYLGSDLDVAVGNFQKFIDLNIIQPVDTSNNAVVKICKTHGIMHEFVLHKSMSEKLVRHFSVHHMHDTNCRTILDLSRVRSLTVFGNAGDAISNFHKYKLIRVLDLEECSDVHDRHLKDICKLWNLRYLSLGANITMLPKEISKLKLLETLDARKTKVTVLPLEVIGLPCLTHLIGKFKLPDQVGTVSSRLEQQSKESKLQTLAGFVADKSQGFAQLMVHMKKLKKVKIWCEFTGDGGNLTDQLSHAIQEYIKAPKDQETDVRSLSLNFERCSEQILQSCYEENKFLHSLKDPCYLSSLKLHGDLSRLHQFVALLKGLRELCLSSTTLTLDLLSEVSKLPFLLYFKLIANHIDNFTIEVGTFKSLRRLRFIMQSLRRLEIKAEALPELVSLQLFCKDLAALSGDEIGHLKSLEEVALDSRVTRGTWVAVARSHPNRPKVLFIERADPTGNEPIGNPVAPEESAPETSTDPTGNEPVGNPVAPEESAPETTIQGWLLGEGSIPSGRQRCPAQSSFNDGLNSTSNNLGFSDTTDDLTGAAQSNPNDALNSTSNSLGFTGRSDNSTNSGLTEFSVAPEESVPETGTQGQLVGEGSEHSGLPMGPENGAVQSSLHDVPNSTSNNLVSTDGNGQSTGISVAPEELTFGTGFPGQQDEEGSDVQTKEENSTFVTSGVKGCPNAGNRTVPFHQNDDNPGP